MMDVKVHIWNADTDDELLSWDVPIAPELGDIILTGGRQMKIVKVRRWFAVETINKPGAIGVKQTLIINVDVNLAPAKGSMSNMVWQES